MTSQNQLYLLDSFSHKDIIKWKDKHKKIQQYCWDHYSYFSYKRSLVMDKLTEALLSSCSAPFESSSMHRAIDYRFSDHPLSAAGSIIADPGGRFNIGDIDATKFPKFAALYLAEDPETALGEKFSLPADENISGLNAQELNLLSNIATVKVRCSLKVVLDLTDEQALAALFNELKHIQLPLNFLYRATRLKIDAMRAVNTAIELRDTVLRSDWKIMPMTFDVPSNPQILGQIAHTAGIEGILYPSTKNGKKCLVIFPDNLKEDSFVELAAEAPKTTIHRRMDRNTFNDFIRISDATLNSATN